MRTLEDLLEEITPRPDPDFAADMDRRMETLRHQPQPARRLPHVAFARLQPRATAAVAASLLLALAVTVSVVATGDPEPDGVRMAGDAGDRAAGGRGAGATELAPDTSIAPSADGLAPAPEAPRTRARRVERSAQLTLAADPAEFDSLADSVVRIAERSGGFVLSSSFTQDDDGTSGGSFELRVPAVRLQQTLNDLSRLATLRARGESGHDVTGPFISLRDRLRAARAERKGLLRRLELAPSDTAASAIRRRLAIVGRRITSLSTQLRAVRERTAYATVLVELVDEKAGATTGETEEALDDAVGYLEGILNFLIRAAAILLPLSVAATLAWLAAAYARRRARDRVLS